MEKIHHFQMNFKSVETKEDKIIIKGFASTPTLDRYDDIVLPTAFSKAMEGYMNNPIILLRHEQNKEIGLCTEYKIGSEGLEITAEITYNEEWVFEKIKSGLLRGLSIGFICKSWEYRQEGEKEIRQINDLDLIEISVVATPANPDSLFTLAKSLKAMFDEMEAEKKETKETADVETEEIPTEVEEVQVETPDEVETPETAEVEDVETESDNEDKSEIVEVDQEQDTDESEVKALISRVEMLEEEAKASRELIGELKESLNQIEAKNADFVKTISSVEINPNYTRTQTKRVLTYSMI